MSSKRARGGTILHSALHETEGIDDRVAHLEDMVGRNPLREKLVLSHVGGGEVEVRQAPSRLRLISSGNGSYLEWVRSPASTWATEILR